VQGNNTSGVAYVFRKALCPAVFESCHQGGLVVAYRFRRDPDVRIAEQRQRAGTNDHGGPCRRQVIFQIAHVQNALPVPHDEDQINQGDGSGQHRPAERYDDRLINFRLREGADDDFNWTDFHVQLLIPSYGSRALALSPIIRRESWCSLTRTGWSMGGPGFPASPQPVARGPGTGAGAKSFTGDEPRALQQCWNWLGKDHVMCRWLAYSGSPVSLEDLLFKPTNSLVVQSKHSRLGAETTNGDGFGVGWYSSQPNPGVFRSTEPAWNDRNLRELSAHARSGRVFAHIRASTGSAVQQSNCHPFRHGRWLWMHNGLIRDFPVVKRELALAVEPGLYPDIEGSTDSETFFFLALTFGLEQDQPAAVASAVGFIEDVGRRHGIENPIQMTVATTDGDTTWAFRYSSEGVSRSLFRSTDISTLQAHFPDNVLLQGLSEDARLVVSEPLGDLQGAWEEVPESTCLVVHGGEAEFLPFSPSAS
jgi:predicted glutamine amidotransferase